MRKVLSLVFCLSILFIATRAILAEQAKRASPHEQVSAVFDGKKVTIDYGRPLKKGREIFGKLVPFGAVWRTGADEATTLSTEVNLNIGGLKVPKGTYSLFTLPTEKEWTLIVNKNPKQWGAYSYDPAQDLGRTKLTVGAAPSVVEQFTIALDAQGKKGTLKLSWDKTVASIAVSAE
jgi:hypothetical protein